MPLYLKPDQIHNAVDNVMENIIGIPTDMFNIREITREHDDSFPGIITQVTVTFKHTVYGTLVDSSYRIYLDDAGNLLAYIEDHPEDEKHDWPS